MSTRANIVVRDSDSELWFYRHSDGYPDGTLPTLKKFMLWVSEGRIRNNISQSAGWLILIGAKEYNTVYENFKERTLKDSELFKPRQNPILGWKCGAYEPTTGQHGDIEYLYICDLTKLQIEIRNPDKELEDIIREFND